MGWLPVLVLAVSILVMDSFPVLSLHLDELGFLRLFQSGEWHAFELYRFYRVIGIPLNYLAYTATGASPLALSLVQCAFFLTAVFGFSRVLAAALVDRGAPAVTQGLFIISVFMPFSMDVLLTRVFPQLVTYALSMLLVRMAWTYDGSWRRVVSIVAIYAVSLFVYEIAMFLPIYLLFIAAYERKIPARAVAMMAVALTGTLALYICTQLAFSGAQPKLVAASTLAVTPGGEMWPEILRKALLPLYYMRWATGYLSSEAVWGTWWIGPIALVAVLLAFALWGAFRVVASERTEVRTGRMAVNGLVLALSAIAPFGYYFVATHHLVTPPLYCLLLFNTGGALVVMAVLRWLACCIAPMYCRVALYGVVLGGLCTGLILFAAGRAAALQTAAEAHAVAEDILRITPDPEGVSQIVVKGLSSDGAFARGRCGFATQLRFAISRGGDSWRRIEARSECLVNGSGTDGKVLVYDARTRAIELVPTSAWLITTTPGQDAYALRIFGYELAFDDRTQRIELRRLLAG